MKAQRYYSTGRHATSCSIIFSSTRRARKHRLRFSIFHKSVLALTTTFITIYPTWKQCYASHSALRCHGSDRISVKLVELVPTDIDHNWNKCANKLRYRISSLLCVLVARQSKIHILVWDYIVLYYGGFFLDLVLIDCLLSLVGLFEASIIELKCLSWRFGDTLAAFSLRQVAKH